MSRSTNTYEESKKYALLAIGMLLDLIGLATYAVPFIGEMFDLIWAPLSAIILWLLYRKSYGSIGGIFSFFEEILPGIDIIPSFTLMWVIKYYLLQTEPDSANITAQ